MRLKCCKVLSATLIYWLSDCTSFGKRGNVASRLPDIGHLAASVTAFEDLQAVETS